MRAAEAGSVYQDDGDYQKEPHEVYLWQAMRAAVFSLPYWRRYHADVV